MVYYSGSTQNSGMVPNDNALTARPRRFLATRITRHSQIFRPCNMPDLSSLKFFRYRKKIELFERQVTNSLFQYGILGNIYYYIHNRYTTAQLNVLTKLQASHSDLSG